MENKKQFCTEGASTVPTDEKFIANVCLSYRHDFGLMEEKKKELLVFECKEWLRAINNNMLKAKGAEYDVLREKINKYQDDSLKHLNEFRYYKIKKEKELKELEELKEINTANVSHIEAANELCKEKDAEIEELKAKNKYLGDANDEHQEEIVKHLLEVKELKAENASIAKLQKHYYTQWKEVEEKLSDLKTLQPNNALSKEKVLDILEHYFGKGVKNSGRHHLCAEAICSLPNAATSAEANGEKKLEEFLVFKELYFKRYERYFTVSEPLWESDYEEYSQKRYTARELYDLFLKQSNHQ